jgi:hypothetical protein
LKENNKLKNKVKNLSNKLESNSKGKHKKMQEEKISHFMCYRCHDMRHIAKYCPTKKPQVEPKAKSQNRVQVNHQDGDLGIKKKKTRRGGKHHVVTMLASDHGGLLSFAGVTTPSEIISYYHLNHSVWSLSDNRESSR